jgi:hypothetical protein
MDAKRMRIPSVDPVGGNEMPKIQFIFISSGE